MLKIIYRDGTTRIINPTSLFLSNAVKPPKGEPVLSIAQKIDSLVWDLGTDPYLVELSVPNGTGYSRVYNQNNPNDIINEKSKTNYNEKSLKRVLRKKFKNTKFKNVKYFGSNPLVIKYINAA